MDNRQTIDFLKKNVLVTSEVCDMLEVSKQRVAKLTKEGILTPFKQSGNGSFYYRGDILRYKYEKSNQWTKGRHMFEQVRAFGFESTTEGAIGFFNEHIDEFDEICNAYFYFNGLDAAIDGFFVLDTLKGENGLYNLKMPNCVLMDKNGHQMWLTSVNCGYKGTGPRGSINLVKRLGVEETKSNLLFSKRVVKFIKDDGIWEAIARDAVVEINDRVVREISASLYYKNGRLVLLQDKRNYSEHRGVDYLSKYTAYIPDVVEILVMPDKVTAIEHGYYKENPFGRLGAVDYYQLILIDASGRELWLNAYINPKIGLKDNEDILSMIKMCGFGYEQEEEKSLIEMMKKLVISKEEKRPKIKRFGPGKVEHNLLDTSALDFSVFDK